MKSFRLQEKDDLPESIPSATIGTPDGTTDKDKIKYTYRIILFIGFASVILGLLSMARPINMWVSLTLGLIYLILGLCARKNSYTAVVIAIILYILDFVFFIFDKFASETILSTGAIGGIIMRLVFLLVMFHGASAIKSRKALEDEKRALEDEENPKKKKPEKKRKRDEELDDSLKFF